MIGQADLIWRTISGRSASSVLTPVTGATVSTPVSSVALSVRPGVACWSLGDANYIARIVPQGLNPSATPT